MNLRCKENEIEKISEKLVYNLIRCFGLSLHVKKPKKIGFET